MIPQSPPPPPRPLGSPLPASAASQGPGAARAGASPLPSGAVRAGADVPPEVAAAAGDPARRLGNHVVLEEIGRGGMGVIYRGFDLGLRRPVAVKMILHAEQAGPEALRRFGREARAAASLRHPNIVAVHEVGEHRGLPYLVMDLVEGGSLDRHIDRAGKPLPPRRAARLVHDLARALDYAHAEGVVHRDVKPQNVLIDGEGRPYLTDFGLARETREATGITRTGAFLGTPGYAPPEQISGSRDRMGPRSDVYALGAVLYHLLTGQPPFVGEGIELLMTSIRERPVPPRQRNAAVHADLETIAMRCLEKEVEQRYESAGALADDLGRYLDGEPILARPVGRIERVGRWVWRRKLRVTGVGLALVASVAAVVLAYRLVMFEVDDAARRAREALVADARADAESAWTEFSQARARLDEPPERDALDRVLGLGLGALNAAGSWRAQQPDDPAAAEAAFRAAMGLGEVAAAAKQWSVASSAFGEAAALGVDDARAQAARHRMEQDRDAAGRAHLEAVDAVLEDARRGAIAERRGGYEDALFEIVGHRDAVTVRRLGEALDAVSERLQRARLETFLDAAEPTADEARAGAPPIAGIADAVRAAFGEGRERREAPEAWRVIDQAARRLERREAARRAMGARAQSPTVARIVAAAQTRALGEGELLLARLCCEALGRIGIASGAIEPLARYLLAEQDELRAVHAGVALCLLGGELAAERVTRAGERFGIDGPFWTQVSRHLDRLRAGEADAEDADADADAPAAIRRRARRLLDAGSWAEAERLYARANELDPDEPDGWIMRGYALIELGRADEALADLERAVALAPRNPAAWGNRGRAKTQKGLLEEAVSDFRQAVALRPDDPLSLANLALALVDLGRVGPALKRAQQAAALAPDDARVAGALAAALAASGRLDEALAAADRAVALDPGPDPLLARARLRRARGDSAAAEADLDRVSALAGGDPNVQLLLSREWRALGRLGRAEAAATKAIEADDRMIAAWVARANARKDQGERERGIADCTRAIELAPGFAHAWNVRGIIRAQAGEHQAALEDMSRAIEIDPDSPEFLSNRSQVRGALGDLEGALADVRRATELAPGAAEHWGNLGNILRSLGRSAESIDAFDRHLAIDDASWRGWFGRGESLRVSGRHEEAIADFTRALERSPSFAWAFGQRAWCHLELGRLAPARADADRAIYLSPGWALGWLHRGRVRAAAGDAPGAIADVEQALALGLGDPADRRIAEELLAELRK